MPAYSNYSDQQLLHAIQHDDESAFAELFQRYWKKAHALAYSKLRSKVATEDIVQDLFARIWDKRKSLSISNVASYIYISIKNSAINHIESSLVHQRYWSYYREFIPGWELTTENVVEYDNLVESIEQGLEGLPNKSKKAFRLNRLDGLSVPEIAQQLNLSEKAIQYHITRSIKHLRLFLKGLNMSFLPMVLLTGILCITLLHKSTLLT